MEQQNYIMLNGLPTSKYGTVLNKRCDWCYCVMIPTEFISHKRETAEDEMRVKEYDIMKKRFCSPDCREEYEDWMCFKKLRYNRERTLQLYHQNHTSTRIRNKIPLDRKEYLRNYHLEHKAKRQQQFKEQRIRRLNNIK